jgi:hypothetical protein
VIMLSEFSNFQTSWGGGGFQNLDNPHVENFFGSCVETATMAEIVNCGKLLFMLK